MTSDDLDVFTHSLCKSKFHDWHVISDDEYSDQMMCECYRRGTDTWNNKY